MSCENGKKCDYSPWAHLFGIMELLAAVISYSLNHSFWWALLAWLFSDVYLIYVVFWRTKEILPALTQMFGG